MIAAHLAKTHVEKLNISSMVITATGLKVLAPVVAASGLKCIDISEDEVGDEGIIALANALRTNKTLQELNATSLSSLHCQQIIKMLAH